MGREIKFRAWDKRINRMRPIWTIDYKASLKENWVMVQMPNDQFSSQPADWGNTKEHIVLMQYTGLKDKNGKEIYEGDILKGGSIFMPKSNKVVEYHGNGFWLINEAGGHFFPSVEFTEIIGNIYENPALLNG